MSASDKKKLRKEQAAELLTQRQRQEQAEAKKLKTYTIIFVAAMLAVVIAVLGILAVRTVNNSGIIQKNTLAATIGDQELNSIELSYYYIDAINSTYNDWYNEFQTYTDTYLEAMGLDTSKPLDEQTNPDTEKSWAQFFVDAALTQAKEDIALYNKAAAEKFELPEEEQKSLDNTLKNIETYAQLYGYSNANQYLRASYGYGADVESYTEYLTRSTIAQAFNVAHKDGLSYEDKQIREHDDKDPAKYDSYNYTSLYLSYSDFLEGGEKQEDGSVDYTDEQREAARKALKAAADKLAKAKDAEDLEKLANEVKKDKYALTEYESQLNTNINAPVSEWLANSKRKAGDVAALANTSTTEDEDGKEVTQTNGYYIVIFHKRIDNTKLMSDVRHLLVQFEGGTTDETTGTTTYTEEEKNKAKTEAEGYLKTWKEGKADEESFIELVKEHSDDSTASEGGLFENIHPDSSYVDNFLNWSIDADRKKGDSEVIETEYGYHVMYYVGNSDMNYRDFLITEELRNNEHTEWYDGLLEAVKVKQGDVSKLKLDMVLAG